MVTAIKASSVTLLAIVVGCQPGRLGAADFPTGTYTRCAQGVHNPSGNEFLNSAGFQEDARLTLAQNGTTVTATYVAQNGVVQSLSFSASGDTVATVTRNGQVIPGFKGLCVLGPGKETPYPASMHVAAGVLTSNAGAVFATLTGELRSEAGACGARSQPRASFWLACQERQGGSAPTAGTEAATPARLPAGRYSCSTQVETFYRANGGNEYVAGGGTGTLNLMRDGAQVTATYSGDPSLAGTLRFTAVTATAAHAAPGQSLMAPCMIGNEARPSSRTPEPASIAAASLTMAGSTLFLPFTGTMSGSSCPGAQLAGSLICTK